MPTKIYGASDDLIEIEGDIEDEIGCYDTDEERPVHVKCSDGTLLSIFYGKPDCGAVWSVRALETGTLLERIEPCDNEDAAIYSDVAVFKDGLLWARRVKGKK